MIRKYIAKLINTLEFIFFYLFNFLLGSFGRRQNLDKKKNFFFIDKLQAKLRPEDLIDFRNRKAI